MDDLGVLLRLQVPVKGNKTSLSYFLNFFIYYINFRWKEKYVLVIKFRNI